MNKVEMVDRLAAGTGLSKADAREAADGVFAVTYRLCIRYCGSALDVTTHEWVPYK